MAVQYKSLYDMPKATQIGPNDRFLVAKGDKDYFTTEAILYDKLSSDTFKILETAKFDVDIITRRDALNQSGTNKVVHTLVINAINNDVNSLKSNCIQKNQDFNCTKNWNFSGLLTFQNYPVATIRHVAQQLDQFDKTHPIYTNLWTNQDMANRRLILSDLLPSNLVPKDPGDMTIYVFFQNKSNTAYTPTVACTVNGAAKTFELFSGSQKIDYNDKNQKSWAHYRLKISNVGTTNPVNSIYLDIDNINSAVMCSLVIYGCHTY